MKARIRLAVSAALLLALATGCGEFTPNSLRIEAKDPLTVGQTTKLRVIAVSEDGEEQEAPGPFEFASSNPGVATVDEDGLVTVHARGDVTLTVKTEWEDGTALEGSLREARPICNYPAFNDQLGHGKVMPPLSWRAYSSDGVPVTLRMEDIYCNVEWRDVKTVHFVFSAVWCNPCTNYARQLALVAPALKEMGMQIITVEIDSATPGIPVDTNRAYQHLKKIADPVAGFSAGDLDTRLPGAEADGANFLRKYMQEAAPGGAAVFPTRIIMRTSDMSIIADASAGGEWSGFGFPLDKIAQNPDGNWKLPSSGSETVPGESEPGGGGGEE